MIWQRTSEEGLNSVKAQGIVNRSPHDMFKLCGNDSYRTLYDANYDCGKMFGKIADQTFYVYQRTKKIAVVSPREFVLVVHFNLTREGAIYIIVTNANRDDLQPETKGIVRGSVPIGGWKFEPVEGNPNQSRCTYLAEVDLKGSIPGFVLKSANKDQGYQIIKMRTAVEKFFKENNY